ncbi:MAG: hypothetical protein JWQ59_984 [Cryobacterium sp.]|nr:hypothetical protein [Cryobacterium sp.]
MTLAEHEMKSEGGARVAAVQADRKGTSTRERAAS